MVYTKEQLEEMSDHEVNLAVAIKWFDGFKETADIYPYTIFNTESVEVYIQHENRTERTIFDPCDNWNDVMHIAEKNEINITWKFKKGLPIAGFWIGGVINENPKRAICEVFLMMDI